LTDYTVNYENHYNKFGVDGSGGGPPLAMGLLELSYLCYAGLKSNDSLLDFGCGIGRLTRYASRYLHDGIYVGSDISEIALRSARENYRKQLFVLNEPLNIQNIIDLQIEFNYIAAFSVFTHMELEDFYNMLIEFKSISNTQTRVVASFISIESESGANIFVEEARINYQDRYKRFRNISTTKSTLNKIIDLAGWNLVEWIDEGKVMNTYCPDSFLVESEVKILSMIQSVAIMILKT
jgi:cyclopropane fatty-acyl-phospholipid synthase-like methyltransferase